MTTKIVTIFKYIAIVSIVIFNIISCESDFENVGEGLVNNSVFNTKKQSFNVLAYTKNIESSQVDNISIGAIQSLRMPLGIYKTDDFGLFKSSMIAQVILPSGLDWETGSVLDAVYLEIPYDSTNKGKNSDGTAKFELNNIFGNKSVSYQIQVKRLETYLSRLDHIDPSKAKKYYSDDSFNIGENLSELISFKPVENDTVVNYQRTFINTTTPITADETIKISESKPFISIPLNKTFFKDHFMNDDNESFFENNNNFVNFFRGIKIEVQGDDGSVMMLDLTTAKLNMYLSLASTTESTEFKENADLNNDNVIDDEDVTTTYDVRNKKVISFSLSGIKTNQFERSYAGAIGITQITSPNTIEGEEKLFVQGAAGSIAVIDLFKGVDLATIRAKNWLINEASLTFYIDNENSNDLPPRLLLYKLADDDNENTQLLDAITEKDTFNGFLQKDSDDNPTKYKVNITDYISEVLKKEDFTTLSTLGLKIYNGLDTPVVNDVLVKDYSWNPQGAVLYGSKYVETDADFAKKLKLEVYYTELK